MFRCKRHKRHSFLALAAALVFSALGSGRVAAQNTTDTIDANGDGAGNVLREAQGIAVDSGGNAYVMGQISNNAFKITPDGVITQIIDATGDGAGNGLEDPVAIENGTQVDTSVLDRT